MFSLNKKERLKSKILIDLLFSKGNVLREYSIKLVWVNTDSQQSEPLVAGFGVSKRLFKRANKRNRIKRLLREAYRLHKNSLQNSLQSKNRHIGIMIIYTADNLTTFKAIEDKIIVILNRLEKAVINKELI